MLQMPVSALERHVLASKVIRERAAVRAGERVLVLTDTRADGAFVESLLASAFEAGAQAASLCLPWQRPYPHPYLTWEEPAAHVSAAMAASDVIIGYRQPLMCLTEAARAATGSGARALWMASDFDNTRPVVVDEDYNAMGELGRRIAELVRRAKIIRVTSPAGTDIHAEYEGRLVSFDDGTVTQPGESDFFPGGMWNSSPIESSFNGTVVFDGTLYGLGVLRAPLSVTFVDGWIRDIAGEQADEWKRALSAFGDPSVYLASHLSGGLARHARLIGNDWEDLIMYGTILFSAGAGAYYDGATRTHAHFDGTVLNATVYLDGEVLLDRGEYVHPTLGQAAG